MTEPEVLDHFRQSGALLALGDKLCLDYVSRPEAFARLYPKLLEGYLLDAGEYAGGKSADWEAFLERSPRRRATCRPPPCSRRRSAGSSSGRRSDAR